MTGILIGIAGLFLILSGVLAGIGAGLLLGGKLGLSGARLAIVLLAGAGSGFIPGAFAGIVYYSDLKHQETEIRRGWNLVPIVVAEVDIEPGQLLTFDMISQRSLPEQFVTADMVKPDSAAFLVNQRVAVRLAQGDVVLWGASCSVTPAPARTP